MLPRLRRFLDVRQKLLSRETVTLFRFGSQQELDQWTVKTDADYFGGLSRARAEWQPGGFVRFSGTLSTELPKLDDKVVRSGFCLLRSPDPPSGWFKKKYLDVGMNNALEIELRGDGRPYIMNLQTWSLNREDIYQAAIYTRGGPHWQTVQLPFSEFLITYMGYVQNEQSLLSNERIRSLGFLLADRVDGPFSLDIRSVRAIYMHKELSNMDATPTPEGDQGSGYNPPPP